MEPCVCCNSLSVGNVCEACQINIPKSIQEACANEDVYQISLENGELFSFGSAMVQTSRNSEESPRFVRLLSDIHRLREVIGTQYIWDRMHTHIDIDMEKIMWCGVCKSEFKPEPTK